MKSTLALIAFAVLWAGVYVLSCWRWPLAHCRCCKGTGKHARRDGKVFRACWWCNGSGRRWRIGRRVWNFFHRHAHT